MRENFVFYKSFYDAIECLGEKAQLKLYKAIMKMSFNCAENVTELEQICSEIETELKQNRNVFAQFLLIKPYLINSAKSYYNGLKGGAPLGNKNAQKNNHKEIDKEIDKEYITPYNPPKKKLCVEEKVKEIFSSELNQVEPPPKQVDPYADTLIDECLKLYEVNCPDLCKLRFERRSRDIRELTAQVLTEIDRDVGVFTEICKKANTLKVIVDKPIDFKKMLNNYQRILNGSYEEVKQKTPQELTREEEVRRITALLDANEERGY